MAEEIQATLRENLPVKAAAKRVWDRLWTDDRRAQVRAERGRGSSQINNVSRLTLGAS